MRSKRLFVCRGHEGRIELHGSKGELRARLRIIRQVNQAQVFSSSHVPVAASERSHLLQWAFEFGTAWVQDYVPPT